MCGRAPHVGSRYEQHAYLGHSFFDAGFQGVC